MIIGSMTGRELFEIFKKDKPMLEKFAIEKAKKLIRELRKGMDDIQPSVMISRRKMLLNTRYVCLLIEGT